MNSPRLNASPTRPNTRFPASESSGRDPVAVIGIGCRFPGASGPDEFWQLLCEGRNAISEVPPDRFQTGPNSPSVRGGFLHDIDRFDNAFFGITPREATRMDPQQRLLMEVAWEALEDAGEMPEALAEQPVGVFIGTMTSDYDDLQYYHTDPSTIDLYTTTGGYRSVIAGRLSHFLDLRGPSVSVDTGCSSSLVSLHLACQSILTGECPLALAGGTNLLIRPERSMGFASAKMLAPDGRCKFADQRANGFVRSEGVGVVVLKAISQAQADGNRIYALIRGSAVYNDGKTSDSMAAPGLEGQQQLLRLAHRRAGTSPGSVSYAEAHGTGTAIGDRTELAALTTVLAEGRPAGQLCLVGSVKTNIGHTEATAGIAGFIKTALALKHRTIPPSIHAENLNPHIHWQDSSIRIPRELTPWPYTTEPAIAGVSSFSISGTNVHVVLQEAPENFAVEQNAGQGGKVRIFTLSAASPEALRAMAGQYLQSLGGEKKPSLFADLCYTRNVHRTHHNHRLAVVAESTEQAREGLSAFLSGHENSDLSCGQLSSERRKLVFVFPGHGPQWRGMGLELFQQEPVFRESIQQCDHEFRSYSEWSLVEELHADEEHSRLAEVDVVQYALFAMGVSLSALWQSWGITPDAVVGHSMGEIAAAYTAGILDLKQAVRVLHSRGKALKRKFGLGAMAIVDVAENEVERMLKNYARDVVIAGRNTRTSTVLSGNVSTLEKIMAELQGNGIFCRKVSIGYASHSAQMDDVTPELLQELQELAPQHAAVPFYSTVSGNLSRDPVCDSCYWAKNLRQPVLFADTVEALLRDEFSLFLEVSPHPVLLAFIQQAIHETSHVATTVPSLTRKDGSPKALYRSLGTMYCRGSKINWAQVQWDEGHCVSLPRYPWQRERFWRDDAEQVISHTAKRFVSQAGQDNLVSSAAEAEVKNAPKSLREELLAAGAPDRKALLETYFKQQLARIIQQPVSRIDTSLPLIKLGVDSLMAFELINRTSVDIGLALPVSKVIGARSIVHLAVHALDQFSRSLGAVATPAQEPDSTARPQIQEQAR